MIMLSLAAFLVLLALLASQLGSGASAAPTRRLVVVRRVYRTTVVETIRGGSGGNSVSQSVSSSGSGAVPVAPLITSSSH